MNTRSSKTDSKENLEDTTFRELRLLEEVEVTPEVSQRHLASQLGVALGVANLLVKNLAKKGYIRASRAGWKKWVYNLTPAGIGRKAHLTAAYVDRVLDHYHRVRLILQKDLHGIGLSPDSRMAIYGTGELAELMYLVLKDIGVNEVVFIDIDTRPNFLGNEVRSLDSIDAKDYVKIMVAHSSNIDRWSDKLIQQGFSEDQIVTLLGTTSEATPVQLGEGT